MLNRYRKAINPPYNKHDLPIILGTLLLFIILPVIVFLVMSGNYDARSRAEKPNKETQGVIGNTVSSVVSDQIRITSPIPNASVSLPLVIQVAIDPSLGVKQVEFWKDQDKEPFAIVYAALDDTEANSYEALLPSLRPGRHTLYVNALTPDDNIMSSRETVISIN